MRASIVIPAWNEWARTAACLDALKPTLGLRDEVIVVDNGSTDGTGEKLRRHPWVRVVSNPENRGFAGGCNDGAAAARGEVVVFLNNDTLPAGRWLQHLLAPFEDEAVAATGPRSNNVSGLQHDPSAAYGSTAELRRHVKAWERAHAGERQDVVRLVGFCLAVRRSAFDAVGGWDEAFGIGGFEDDDLCRRLSAAGWRLVLAHDAYVHHDGHATFTANGLDWHAVQEGNRAVFADKHARATISACLIVKDEEEDLPGCLASLAGLVDEVVVHDTGSTDRTVELARAAGALVVEGTWEDDFGGARNVALERCTGDWVLHLDADERLEADPAAVRAALAATAADALLLEIRNLVGSRVAPSTSTHSAVRLFRRTRGCWAGRIHEQVVARAGQPALRLVALPGPVIHHDGYLQDVMAAKGKVERNLHLATLAAESAPDRAIALFDLGRSLTTAGRPAEAVEVLRSGLRGEDRPEVLRPLLRQLADAHLALGEADQALEAVARLRSVSRLPALADLLEGRALVVAGRPEEALAVLGRLGSGDVADEDGSPYARRLVTSTRARALGALDRHAEAADVLLEQLRAGEAVDATWGPLLQALRDGGRTVADVVDHLPPGAEGAALGSLVGVDLAAAGDLARVLLAAEGATTRAVALGSVVGARGSLEEALAWSVELRGVGADDACPLLRRTEDAARDVVAAGVAASAFGDPRAARAAAAAAADLTPGAMVDALAALGEVAPQLLPEVVAAAARGGATRATAVADALRQLGAEEQAELVLATA